jgi:hypothetical protein
MQSVLSPPVRADIGEVGRVAAGEAAAVHGVAGCRNERHAITVIVPAAAPSASPTASPACRC